MNKHVLWGTFSMLILCFLLLALLLVFPETAAEGGRNGLVLWATVLVPSLLPFSILTSLLRKKLQGNRLCYLLLTAGILSGYPIGAKIAGDLYNDGSLTKKQAVFFAGAINNPSPMFVIFFVGESLLHLGSGKYFFYLTVLLSAFLGSVCFYLLTPLFQGRFSLHVTSSGHPPVSSATFSEQLDEEISASALLLIKIGGYIVIFSILAMMIQSLPVLPPVFQIPLCGLLEITTGNAMICGAGIPHNVKIILCLAITAFGGLSAAAQTNSVLRNTGLSIVPYVIIKIFSSIFALLLGFLLW